jgi:hypothetical protein
MITLTVLSLIGFFGEGNESNQTTDIEYDFPPDFDNDDNFLDTDLVVVHK